VKNTKCKTQKDIHIYIDGTDAGSIGALSGGINATIADQNFEIWILLKGQKLRLRAVGAGGAIQDTVIKLTVKWRG